MRIVMVSDVYFPRVNGVSTAIQTYRETLRARGVEVSLIAPDYGTSDDEAWVTRVAARPVPGDPEDRLAHWGALRRAVDQRVAQGCDLIHVQTPFAAHYAALGAARRHERPLIATYHTLFEEYLKHYVPLVPPAGLRWLARRFSRHQCNALDAVIVPSRAIHGRLQDYGVKTPLHVLPTGVSLLPPAPAGRHAFRARHGIAATRPLALFVGRVAHEKNIGFLLDVLDRARQTLPRLLLLIAGEGPALGVLRKIVDDRGLGGHVKFLGYLERRVELPECYAAADVFVFASRTETQGLVLLEAMTAGLPVVALAAMGTIDILATGRGALTPADDPAAFSAALCRVLEDSALRRRLADEARLYAAEWSAQALAEKLHELYRKIIARPQRRKAMDFSLSPL